MKGPASADIAVDGSIRLGGVKLETQISCTTKRWISPPQPSAPPF
ncbi:MAG: hypothetical protein ACLR7U_15090 [Ruthenibacterium lactatiformans]